MVDIEYVWPTKLVTMMLFESALGINLLKHIFKCDANSLINHIVGHIDVDIVAIRFNEEKVCKPNEVLFFGISDVYC